MTNYNKLKTILFEMFEIDKADLDFGIYRIMNQKRDAVMDFINNKLPKDIKDILSQTSSVDKIKVEAEMNDLAKVLESAGIVKESAPKYIALKEKLNKATDINALEQDIFSHLANFFKRYYQEGDFISQRRYKKDVYAIPYEGEEVKLHWANADQYYIKTSEYLKNYAFILKDGKKVHFQLKEANTEQNNNKAQGNEERRFALYTELPYEEIDGELYINFTYELHSKSVKQTDLIKEALNYFNDNPLLSFAGLYDKLPTDKNKNRTVLEKNLTDFVSRNTFDYFIHKDLSGFLNRELDFYIKNEVLYIDDIDTENPEYFVAQLSKIKALKSVAQKIIAFLAQVENFQKKLWLKKKLVIRTDWCITLDRIPESYYEDIVANKAQLEEWKLLFDVDVLNVEQLHLEPYLVLDTKFFSEEFKDALMGEFDNLDEDTDGLLINSENFQALNLMQEKYKESVQCTYIDPPFNKDQEADYLYRVNYKDSTWLNLLFDRMLISRGLLKKSSSFFLRCDFDGNYLAREALNGVFATDNFLNEIIINRINKQDPKAKKMNVFTDSLFFYSNDADSHKFNHVYVKLEKPKPARWHSMDSQGQGQPSFIFGKKLTPPNGRHWTYGQESILRMEKSKTIRVVCRKCSYIHSEGALKECPSCSNDRKFRVEYFLEPTNTKQIGTNWTDISGYSSKWKFKTENSEKLLERVINVGTDNNHDIVLDFFLGSGTTAVTALKLHRKYIGVEMGTHFDSVVIPRFKQTISSKGEEPSGISKDINFNGVSIMFKYQVLESYEDTLNNLKLNAKEGVLQFSEQAQEEYLLNYMLDMETQDHLFNIEIFKNPFNYKLNVTENNELIPTRVDLVETFNYLIGLYVNRMQRVKNDSRDIKFVEGITRNGEKTLVIWRNCEITSNEEVQKVFRKLYQGTLSREFDQIYINGDHHFRNMRLAEDRFKVNLIESEFFKRMFEDE